MLFNTGQNTHIIGYTNYQTITCIQLATNNGNISPTFQTQSTAVGSLRING